MKKLCLLVALATFSAQVVRGNIVRENLPPEAANCIHVQQCTRTADGLTLSLSFDSPVIEAVGESGSLQLASFIGKGMRQEPGKPAIPTIGSLFRLPPSGGVTVEILDAEFELITGIEYAACSGELDELEYGTCVAQDAWYPESLVDVGEPAIFHDFRVANLLTHPVQVNTARNEVRVYNHMNITIRFDSNDNRNSIPCNPSKLSATFLPWYREFLDWDEDELDEYEFYQGNVVVVMQDDPVLWANLADWIEWKQQKGWKLDFLTNSDVNQWISTEIIGELSSRYEAAEEKFDFVIIVGDDTGPFTVPASSNTGYGAGDIHYGRLAGHDWLVDVAVGRMSVETIQQVQIISNKIVSYESSPYLNDTEWYQHAMLYRSDPHAGISKIMTLRHWRHLLLENGYTQVDTSWNGDEEDVIEILESGVSVYSHRGYLGTGLYTHTITSLANDYLLPAVIDLTCGTGNWSDNTALSELWLRAGSVFTPTGGIGSIGMSTSSNRPDMINPISGGAAHSLLVQHNPEYGLMWQGSEVNLWLNQDIPNETPSRQAQQWCNLMGDPTTWLWTAVPESLVLDIPHEVSLGENQIEVQVSDIHEVPVQDAWVTFYKVDESEEVIYTSQTDANGYAILQAVCGFPGSGTITVTKRNHIPAIDTVLISNRDSLVSYADFHIVDNGLFGSSGNGDGIAQNGETVGLVLMLKNYSETTHTDVTVTGSSDDPLVSSITGTIFRETLAAQTHVWGTEAILVQLSGAIADHWIVHIDLEFDSDQGHYTSEFSFPVRSPQYCLVSAEMSDIEPGENGELTVEIQNCGGHAAESVSGILYGIRGMIDGQLESEFFGDMAIGEAATATFSISSDATVLPGIQVSCLLMLTSENGNRYNLTFPVNFGHVDSADVTGPDQYGYIAIENTDEIPGDSLVPEYNWIEINPNVHDPDFTGTLLALEDVAENGDDAMAIPLPFSIQYYGQSFDTISVSTNGYVAMGNQADLSLARNWTIPSPLGPNYMIAPYWDELQTTNDAAIAVYHDTESGVFIVEFYKMRYHVTTATCTFEIIFYDTSVYPTETGDNNFTFQYGACDHSPGGMTYDLYYWTTGIENGTQTDGLQLAYFNNLHPTIAEIDSGKAIFFTVAYQMNTFEAEGYVISASDSTPLADAIVYTDLHDAVVTDSSGYFNLPLQTPVPTDIYIEKECCNPYSVQITPYIDDISNLIIPLTAPDFSLDRYTCIDTLAPDETSRFTIQVSNPGNGPLKSSLTLEAHEENVSSTRWIAELDEQWTRIPGFPLLSEDADNQGIASDGETFWVSCSNGANPFSPNMIYNYSLEGDLIQTRPQPVPLDHRSFTGMRDLAWDDGCLYGVDNQVLYEMIPGDYEFEVAFTMDVPVSSTDFLTVDVYRGLFWMSGPHTYIYGVNLNGNVEQTVSNHLFNITGGDMMRHQQQDNTIALMTWGQESETARIIEFDPDTETLAPAPDSFVEAFEEGPKGACIFSNTQRSSWNLATIVSFDGVDSVLVWEIDTYDGWVSMPEYQIEVPPGESYEVPIQINSIALPSSSYVLDLVFNHNACSDAPNRVMLQLVVSGNAAPEENAGRPLEWKLDAIWPNPFNPTARIRYGIKEATSVDIRVYDILGREVTVLAHEQQAAGWYTVPFTANDFASGVYFVQINAGPLHETRKMILLK